MQHSRIGTACGVLYHCKVNGLLLTLIWIREFQFLLRLYSSLLV